MVQARTAAATTMAALATTHQLLALLLLLSHALALPLAVALHGSPVLGAPFFKLRVRSWRGSGSGTGSGGGSSGA